VIKVIKLFYYIKLIIFRKKWKRKNKHNMTCPKNIFPLAKINVGDYTYGPLEVYSWNDSKEFLKIGKYVSIAKGVKFILGGNHNLYTISTYPFKVKFLKEKEEAWSKGSIEICDDVWIGMDSMILSGVKVGRGAVIGAGTVVSKDVPPYAIVVGNPAVITKYRFEEDIIRKLDNIDFTKLSEDFIKNNINLFYEKLDLKLLDKIEKEGKNII